MRQKFFLPFFLILLLLAAGFLYWLPSQFEEVLTEELLSKGKLITETLDKASIGGLTVYDRQALNQLAKGFIRSSEILYTVIVDKDGQVMSDNGLEEKELTYLRNLITYVQKVESDYQYRGRWMEGGESCFHLARPVYFEKVRIGTILLGLSTREIDAKVRQFYVVVGLLLLGVAGVGYLACLWAAHSISSKIRKIADGLHDLADPQLETLAGNTKEFNHLVESILKQKNLFKSSLSDMEAQRVKIENELTLSKEENNTLTSRLNVVTKQVEELQENLKTLQEQSKHITQYLPILEFASGVAPEIDNSMRQVCQSASQLNDAFDRLKNLIELYEKALPQTPEDREVIRQYKEFIQYEGMKESMAELVSTIRGGSNWAEQLADILKQLSWAREE